MRGSKTRASAGASLRSFVRLLASLTRFNAATGAVWVGEHGPMSTGDEVVVGDQRGMASPLAANDD